MVSNSHTHITDVTIMATVQENQDICTSVHVIRTLGDPECVRIILQVSTVHGTLESNVAHCTHCTHCRFSTQIWLQFMSKHCRSLQVNTYSAYKMAWVENRITL